MKNHEKSNLFREVKGELKSPLEIFMALAILEDPVFQECIDERKNQKKRFFLKNLGKHIKLISSAVITLVLIEGNYVEN